MSFSSDVKNSPVSESKGDSLSKLSTVSSPDASTPPNIRTSTALSEDSDSSLVPQSPMERFIDVRNKMMDIQPDMKHIIEQITPNDGHGLLNFLDNLKLRSNSNARSDSFVDNPCTPEVVVPPLENDVFLSPTDVAKGEVTHFNLDSATKNSTLLDDKISVKSDQSLESVVSPIHASTILSPPKRITKKNENSPALTNIRNGINEKKLYYENKEFYEFRKHLRELAVLRQEIKNENLLKSGKLFYNMLNQESVPGDWIHRSVQPDVKRKKIDTGSLTNRKVVVLNDVPLEKVSGCISC